MEVAADDLARPVDPHRVDPRHPGHDPRRVVADVDGPPHVLLFDHQRVAFDPRPELVDPVGAAFQPRRRVAPTLDRRLGRAANFDPAAAAKRGGANPRIAACRGLG